MDWMNWFASDKRLEGWCPFCTKKIVLHGLEDKCPECKHKLTQICTIDPNLTVADLPVEVIRESGKVV